MRTILFLLILIFIVPVFGQQNLKLKLVNTRNPEKVKYFNNGDRVLIYYENNEIDGYLQIVDKSTIVVDSQMVDINQVPIIVNRKNAGFLNKTAGVTIAAAGSGVAILGFAFFFKGIGSGMPSVLYMVPGGLIVSIVGVQVVSAGFRMIVGKGKRYYLGLDWKAEIVDE